MALPYPFDDPTNLSTPVSENRVTPVETRRHTSHVPILMTRNSQLFGLFSPRKNTYCTDSHLIFSVAVTLVKTSLHASQPPAYLNRLRF